MGKFTTSTATTGRFSGRQTNLGGGTSYKVSNAKQELASVVLASMLNKDNYYQNDSDRVDMIMNLVKNLDDKAFAAKAAIYARNEANLRSVSHVLMNAVAECPNRNFSLRSAVHKAVIRPDDMIEMFAFWKSRHSGMIPNAMRRAFADMLGSNKWDAYQLKKYMRPNQSVKLRDIILMSHPKDKNGLLKGVIEGTLQAPETMEKALSSGKKASRAFDELLVENRLGYMAAVKNIRNALESGISDESLDLWVKLITNRNRVLKSRMLPFRFVDAWDEVRDLRVDHFKLQKVKEAFNVALVHSANNLGFVNDGEKVALILDESGSMSGQPWKNAITLAAVLYHAFGGDRVVSYAFSGDARKLEFGNEKPLDIIQKYRGNRGWQTLYRAPLEELTRTRTYVDKLIVLTDMQLYAGGGDSNMSFDPYWEKYKNAMNKDAMVLFWDLSGYGVGTPLRLTKNILLASGFSDKLLSVIPKMWKDKNALVKEIEAIEI